MYMMDILYGVQEMEYDYNQVLGETVQTKKTVVKVCWCECLHLQSRDNNTSKSLWRAYIKKHTRCNTLLKYYKYIFTD